MTNLHANSSQQPAMPDYIGPIVLIAVSIWVMVIAGGQSLAHFSVAGISTQTTNWTYAGFPLVQIVLLLIPLLPLAIFWRQPRYKAIYQTWLLAAMFGVFAAPAYLPGATAAQTQALLHIVFWLLYAILIIGLALFTLRRQNKPLALAPSFSAPALLIALLVAAIFAYPWLAWGALGSPLDTALQLLAGLAFGLSAALTLELFLLRPLVSTSSHPVVDFLVAGFASGIALMLMTSALGFPFGVLQLVLTISLPALGWTVASLRSPQTLARSQWPALTILIGLSIAAPMLLVDADELALVISGSAGEILSWVFFATWASLALGWIIGGVALAKELLQNARPGFRARNHLPAILLSLGLVIACVVGGMIYFTAGQPGLYGDGLFVILKDQADVSQASNIANYQERRQYVYDTLVAHADSTQAGLRQAFERLGLDYTPYYLVNAVQVNGGPLLRLWLLTRPEVDRVLDNPWLRPLPLPPPTGTGSLGSVDGPEWNLTMIGADRVWNELDVTGQGIIVGQSDSGVQGDHPELADSYRGQGGGDNYNWYDPWNGTTQPTDIGGHGTHTLGTILGRHTGVAPGATWYGCVNLARNLGNPALYLDCMQFMLAPFPQDGNPLRTGDPALGAHVLNNSWGCPDLEGCDADSLLYAVRNLRAAGVFVVVSAGNDGPSCATLNAPPAIYDEVFSVGAIDFFGQIAPFSSIGPVTADDSGRIKPDIVAPGVNVLSSTPGNTYAAYSGTSMAGPHVVGVVALMWSANPNLIGDIERTEQIMIETAQPYTGALPDCPAASQMPSTASGYGVVDAYNAVKAAMQQP